MPGSKLTDALQDWRDEQKKKMPGEPAFMFSTSEIGVVTYEDGTQKIVLRADTLLETLLKD